MNSRGEEVLLLVDEMLLDRVTEPKSSSPTPEEYEVFKKTRRLLHLREDRQIIDAVARICQEVYGTDWDAIDATFDYFGLAVPFEVPAGEIGSKDHPLDKIH